MKQILLMKFYLEINRHRMNAQIFGDEKSVGFSAQAAAPVT